MPAPSRRRSLWALPAVSDAALFAAEINRLAAMVDSEPFPPHITLAGAVPHEFEVDNFAAFTVTLIGLSDSDERFRCVTVTAESDELVALHASCGGDTATYEPHLSLVYAELPPETRAALRTTVDLPLPMTITVDAVSLVDTSDGDYSRWTTERVWPLA